MRDTLNQGFQRQRKGPDKDSPTSLVPDKRGTLNGRFQRQRKGPDKRDPDVAISDVEPAAPQPSDHPVLGAVVDGTLILCKLLAPIAEAANVPIMKGVVGVVSEFLEAIKVREMMRRVCG